MTNVMDRAIPTMTMNEDGREEADDVSPKVTLVLTQR